MPKEIAVVKGSKVKSVHVGPVWTEVTIAIPTGAVVRRGETRNPKSPESLRKIAKKAVAARQDSN
jgi:molybdopterin-binding protein